MDTMTGTTDKDQPAGLQVDGSRPAVEWVTSLPKAWKVTSVERLVLLTVACDSYDGKEARPGWPLLSAATGIDQRDVRKAVERLEVATEHRPALVRVEDNKGGSRARIVLLDPRNLGSTAPGHTEQPAEQPAGQPGVHSPTTVALALAPEVEEETVRLVDAVAALIAEVDPIEAAKVRRSPPVRQAAAAAAAEGYVVADLLIAWRQQGVTGIRSSGPGLAVFLLGRLGKPLPAALKPARGGSKKARSPIAAGTVADHGTESTQSLAEGAAGWSTAREA